jgi:hypothetical protein
VLTAFEGRRALDQTKLADCNAKAIAKAGQTTVAAQ